MRRQLVLGVFLTMALGCAGSEALRAARAGSYATLKTQLEPLQKSGDLSNGEAYDLAKAVATYELEHAKPDTVVDRLYELRPCARELGGPISNLADNHDYVGSEAALILLEAGKRGTGSSKDLTNPIDAWRAVAARGLTGSDDHEARFQALRDPSPLVRRQAIRAAFEAKDSRDMHELSEVARLDPDMGIRVEAVRALGRLPTDGSPVLANRLRDLWTGGDHEVREAIAAAWARPQIFAAGGRAALEVLVAGSHGPGVIEGARALLDDPSEKDSHILDTATGHLLRAIEQGSLREKQQAIAVAPIAEGCAKDALQCERPGKLARAIEGQLDSNTSDDGVKLSASARLLSLPGKRDMAIQRLEHFAIGDNVDIASRAQFILARAKHLPVQVLVEKELSSSDADRRLAALDTLAAMGRASRGAMVLADDNVSIRTKAACTILVASRTKS